MNVQADSALTYNHPRQTEASRRQSSVAEEAKSEGGKAMLTGRKETLKQIGKTENLTRNDVLWQLC